MKNVRATLNDQDDRNELFQTEDWPVNGYLQKQGTRLLRSETQKIHSKRKSDQQMDIYDNR